VIAVNDVVVTGFVHVVVMVPVWQIRIVVRNPSLIAWTSVPQEPYRRRRKVPLLPAERVCAYALRMQPTQTAKGIDVQDVVLLEPKRAGFDARCTFVAPFDRQGLRLKAHDHPRADNFHPCVLTSVYQVCPPRRHLATSNRKYESPCLHIAPEPCVAIQINAKRGP